MPGFFRFPEIGSLSNTRMVESQCDQWVIYTIGTAAISSQVDDQVWTAGAFVLPDRLRNELTRPILDLQRGDSDEKAVSINRP